MAIHYYETRGPSLGTVQDTDPAVTPPETILVDMGPSLGLQRVAAVGDAQFYQADNGPTLGLGRVAVGGGGDWILTTGFWNDAGHWDNAAHWKDGP